jgi:hypothetical protein
MVFCQFVYVLQGPTQSTARGRLRIGKIGDFDADLGKLPLQTDIRHDFRLRDKGPAGISLRSPPHPFFVMDSASRGFPQASETLSH